MDKQSADEQLRMLEDEHKQRHEQSEIAAHQVDEPQSPDPGKGVKEPVNEDEVDSKGVPIQNRLAEERRKNERLREDMDSLKTRLEQIESEKRQASINSFRDVNVGVPQNQPQPYQAPVPNTQQQQQFVDEDGEPRYVTAEEVQQINQREFRRIQNDTYVLNSFPELQDSSSELFSAAMQVRNSKIASGIDVADPDLVRDSVELAYARLVRAGKIVPKQSVDSEESNRRNRADSGAIPRSNSANAEPERSTTRLTSSQEFMQRRLADAGFSIPKDEYLKRAQLYQETKKGKKS